MGLTDTIRRLQTIILLVFCAGIQLCSAQSPAWSIKVVDAATNQPLEGVTVLLVPGKASGVTNARGIIYFKETKGPTTLQVSAIGYGSRSVLKTDLETAHFTIALSPQAVQLSTVTVASRAGDQYRPISKIDIALRGVANSQEVLRIVPGLFIGQHQGGGKAEQIFLRGFDCDHGTDIRLDVDGIPINMVSHAHGQGFADSHFIIPETIAQVDFKKGPYYAEKGNFCTTGYVDFHTKDALEASQVKIEAGMFHDTRVLAMVNLLGKADRNKHQSWYAASEYHFNDSYFDHPQHFNRFNLFSKFNSQLSGNTSFSMSVSTLQSKWDASGQIPERAVSKGLIGYYGAIDPNEGGITSRTNINAQLTHSGKNGDVIKQQLYYSYYAFDLHTNFTFYLVDPVNGDEIRQQETRNVMGYNGVYEHVGYLNNIKLSSEAGIGLRVDATHHTALSHTVDRTVLIQPIKLGNINEVNAGAYVNETLQISDRLSLNGGLRFDQFFNSYNNLLAADSTLPGKGHYRAHDNIVSPKFSVYYHFNDQAQVYVSTGKGFHSNDTRAVVARNGTQVLPAAYGTDVGLVFKPVKNMFINAALWYIFLQQEFVYGGDGGSVEFNGRTRRVGFDFTGRYQPLKSLYVDADLNYALGHAVDNAKGDQYIPLAPRWSSAGGVTYVGRNGIGAGLRYRYLSDRPANTDNSLVARGYFVNDLVVNYTRPKYALGVTVNNVLNTKWKETQFATLSRLRGEAAGVNDICFTAGTPLAVKCSITMFFR